MNNLKPLRPEELEMEMLLRVSIEGRLFIVEKKEPTDRETVKRQISAYVQRIDSLATVRFRASVDALWDDIFRSDGLMALMMPKRKARKCRDFDKYGVMRIIGVLREHGVYEQYSDRKYIALLEQTAEDCSYRSYLSAGIEQRALLLEIRQIVAELDI